MTSSKRKKNDFGFRAGKSSRPDRGHHLGLCDVFEFMSVSALFSFLSLAPLSTTHPSQRINSRYIYHVAQIRDKSKKKCRTGNRLHKGQQTFLFIQWEDDGESFRADSNAKHFSKWQPDKYRIGEEEEKKPRIVRRNEDVRITRKSQRSLDRRKIFDRRADVG